jgi:hypothetical protein
MAVAIFPEVVVSLGVPEWGQGAAGIGMDAIGAAATGMDATGAVAIGMAIGTGITVTIMSSSSATSAFPAGGAGVGVGAGILTEVTPIMDTMITGTHTVTTATVMDINIPAPATVIMGIVTGMVTAMDTPMEIVANTRLLPGRK